MKEIRLRFCLLILIVFNSILISAKEYHVSIKGSDTNDGSSLKPFKTISAAVKFVFPGDTITVHAGTYREWINPVRGGESDSKRIVYRAAPGEKAEIKGSEIITGWKKEKEGIWKVIIPNTFFGDYNPYQNSVFGDWFSRLGRIRHTGEVFLNGKSLYEKETLAKVLNPVPDNKIKDPEGSTYTWYCESDAINTIIWANFQRFNPNKELIEISTRRTCFYPEVKLVEEGDNIYLNLTLNQEYYTHKGQIITSELLGSAKIPKTRFENADGTALILDKDFFGHIRSSENSVAGPFVGLAKGNMTLKLW